ncbi:MAG: gamma-glutamyl-gamma-aminobutyrate hydrolase family protein [Phycisphaerae bacterium]|jgi:putative glutamine amidotransferase|nr:gamma-glutamyl-gamma-aminobutyrate hydrolase family protein [Phycisphaerae bacterium]
MLKYWTRTVLLGGIVFMLAGGCGGGSSLEQGAGDGPRPVIGISSMYIPDGEYTKVNSTYTRAVREAGGTPLILPVIEDKTLVARYAGMLDGLLLTGGDDVPPEAYGQTPLKQTKTLSPKRHAFEQMILEAWLPTGKPILGVCRGLQQTNVVCGGTLVQDIPTQVGTSVTHRGKGNTGHAIKIEPDTKLRALLSTESVTVNSNHHQAARKVGRNLRIAARSADGLIEALEFTDGRFGLLVQWHPERMPDVHRKAIFGAFVRACRVNQSAAADNPR